MGGRPFQRLPRLADDLVKAGAAVIVGNGQAAEAAKAITTSIAIVFVTADDPVQRGLVASLSRPGANVTGITFFGGGQLGAKRLELLGDLAPKVTTIAFLMDARFRARPPSSRMRRTRPEPEASASSPSESTA